jgi:hypothetical protein
MQWMPYEDKATCTICEEKSDEGLYRCTGKLLTLRRDMSDTLKAAVRTHTVDVLAWYA